MSVKRIEREDGIDVIYMRLKDNFGFYRVRPGKEPYICLNERLLEGSENVHQTVYLTLLDYHRAIPEDSPYRLFPLTRYFKELVALTQDEVVEVVEVVEGPEIVIFGRATRRWNFPVYLPQNFRMIG